MAKAAVHAAVLILYLAGARASFRIVDDEFEGASSKPVLLKVLENTDTGESASVIYSHGGRVEQVSLVPRGARASAEVTKKAPARPPAKNPRSSRM